MSKFKEETKIDLTEYTQPEFSNVYELSRLIVRTCQGNYVLSEQKTLPSELDLIPISNIKKPLLMLKIEG